MNENTRITAIQLIKYAIVGVSNSLITLIVIFVCNELIGLKLMLADTIGYIAGVINSFIWNKEWVFKTHDTKIIKEAFLFLGGFLLCFGLQFITLLIIRNPMKAIAVTTLGSDFTFFGMDIESIGEYAAVLIGMAVYTLSNYLFNRCITFRSR
ncbi:MAG: GtrA family protein [Muribaculaceae bacterium]